MKQFSNYWICSVADWIYPSLAAAKEDLRTSYSVEEKLHILHGSTIAHVIDEEIVSTVYVRAGMNGELSFTRPVKQPNE